MVRSPQAAPAGGKPTGSEPGEGPGSARHLPSVQAAPKVSFGVPVRNGGAALELCLKNLLAQTMRDIEIVVSDNASTDGTAEICRRFAETDSRIRYFRQDADLGAMGNFLFVLEQSRGEFFAWRAHDDLSLPDFAEKLSQMLEARPGAGLAVGRVHWDNQAIGLFRSYHLPDTRRDAPLRLILRQFIWFTPHWYYGLYRREQALAFARYLTDVIGERTYHSDIVAMAWLLVQGRIVTAPVTTFVGRRLDAKAFDHEAVTSADLWLAVRSYREAIEDGLARSDFRGWERAIIRLAAFRFLDRRVVRFKRLLRAWFRSGPRAAAPRS